MKSIDHIIGDNIVNKKFELYWYLHYFLLYSHKFFFLDVLKINIQFVNLFFQLNLYKFFCLLNFDNYI